MVFDSRRFGSDQTQSRPVEFRVTVGQTGDHNSAGLAAALRNVVRLPGALDRLGAVGAEALDRDDLVPLCVGQGRQAGAYRLPVEMDGACAAAPTPQPNLVPVRPTMSRTAHKSGICGSASIVCATPLILICGMGFLSGCCYGTRVISSAY